MDFSFVDILLFVYWIEMRQCTQVGVPPLPSECTCCLGLPGVPAPQTGGADGPSSQRAGLCRWGSGGLGDPAMTFLLPFVFMSGCWRRGPCGGELGAAGPGGAGAGRPGGPAGLAPLGPQRAPSNLHGGRRDSGQSGPSAPAPRGTSHLEAQVIRLWDTRFHSGTTASQSRAEQSSEASKQASKQTISLKN